MTNKTTIIDQAFKLDAEIKAKQAELKALKDTIREFGPGFYEAAEGDAEVYVNSVRCTINVKAAQKALGSVLDPFLKFSTPTPAVKFTAKGAVRWIDKEGKAQDEYKAKKEAA